MTQDETIEMARKSGAVTGKPTPDGPTIVFTQRLNIYAFAKMVAADAAAKEREACAKRAEIALVRNHAPWYARQDVLEAVRARGQQ